MKQRLNPWEYEESTDNFLEFAVAFLDDDMPSVIAEYKDDGSYVYIEDIDDDYKKVIVGRIGNKSLREMEIVPGWYGTLKEAEETAHGIWREIVESEPD